METISIQLNRIEAKLENKERKKNHIWLDPIMLEVLKQRIDGSQSLSKIDRETVSNLETKINKIIDTNKET